MADIAKLITQLDEALRDESTAADLRRVARILIEDPVVQTTIAPLYASTSRVERLAEELSELRERITATDRARAKGDDSLHSLITSTANSIYAEFKTLEQSVNSADQTYAYGYVVEDLIKMVEDTGARLAAHAERIEQMEQRVSDCELAVATDKLAAEPNIPANDPEPPVDTSWHPYDVLVEGVIHDHPKGDKRVMTLVRGGNNIMGPWRAAGLNWAECDDATIIAWRYAKEGE